MELFDAIYTARTMRRLKPDPVATELIAKILDAGIRAGSAFNNQEWTFVVVTDPSRRAALAEIFRGGRQSVLDGYQKRVLPPHITAAENQSHLDAALYLIDHFHEAPVIIIPCLTKHRVSIPSLSPDEERAFELRLAGASIYPAIQNIILACRAFGLGAVVTAYHLTCEDKVKRALEIPDEVMTFAMIPIGYPMDEFRRVTRKPVRKVAFLDRWGGAWPGQSPE
ncbi:MAG: nitroreductase family protein [Candidatus Binataceae bacterium]